MVFARIFLSAMVIAIGSATATLAADLSEPKPVDAPLSESAFDDRWQFTGAIYLWGAAVDGEIGKGRFGPATINASFGDILSNLDIAVMGVAEAHYDKFGLLTDVVYTRLSASGSAGPLGLVRAKATNDQLVFTAMGTYRVVEDGKSWVDVMAGARLWHISGDLTLTGPGGRSISTGLSETWVDPMVGMRVYAQGASPLYLTAWGMIGGFGAAADIDGDILAGVGYKITNWASIYAGYRAYGVDYSKDNFSFDAIQHGPVIAGVFRF